MSKRILTRIKRSAYDLFSLFLPDYCHLCGTLLSISEHVLCFECSLNLPRIHKAPDDPHPAEKLFWGRINFRHVMALYLFQKSNSVQKLIHELKYKGNKSVGHELGIRLGNEWSKNVSEIPDIIIPVPLHRKKQRIRGYNQSEIIAQGISSVLNIPVKSNAVIRASFTKTQTRKSRFARWENVENIFSVVSSDSISGKHILIVDDVLTTGATLESLSQSILKTENTTLSILVAAMAID